jgi:hypothetical protein
VRYLFEERIRDLINTDEDEFHDFKLEWYTPYQKDEMIKDIFSFVNTAHHQDCYLIFGVHDGDRKIVGIEDDENRLNNEEITQYLNNLPIANRNIPKIVIKTISVDNHLIDVLVIKDNNDVPVYLEKEFKPKKCRYVIRPGQIFCRMNGIETPINGTANDYQVEKLWKKRFGLDLSINDQYKVKLLDVNNWEYFENDQVGFRYNPDPDYCMYLIDDTERRYRVESYSLSQWRTKMDWQVLKLMYRNRLIKNILVVWLDGCRFVTVTPEIAALNQATYDKMLTFQCIYADTLDFYVENFLFTHKNYSTSSDYLQRSHLLKDIVVFKDKNQRDLVIELLKNKISEIQAKVQPSKEQIKKYKGKLSIDFNNSDIEYSDDNIEHMCKEKNVSEFVNNFIDYETDIERPSLLFLD